MTQLPLDFAVVYDYSIESYFVDPAVVLNPLDILLKPHLWGDNTLLVCGTKAAGKTHLAHIYAQKHSIPVLQGANTTLNHVQDKTYCVIDNVDTMCEQTLFHALNTCKQNQTKCVLTSTHPIQTIPFKTPDVISRLQQAMLISLKNPSDIVLHHILLKTLNDYNIFLTSEVVSYIIPRLHRSYEAVQSFVKTLNTKSLSEKTTVTIPFVREILDALDSPKFDI